MTTPTGILRYPYEAITDTTDYLQIAIITNPRTTGAASTNYTSTSLIGSGSQALTAFSVQNTFASNLETTQLVENGVILLPMPSNIEDTNSVSYDGDTLNGLAGAAYDATRKFVGTNIFDTSQVATNLAAVGTAVDTALKDPGLKNLALNAIAAQAVNLFGSNISLNSVLARSQGKILNPNMELLFNNVTLRTFRFSFKMVARDENESLQIKAIIRTLKKNMAAKTLTESNNLFLQTPNIFELQYKKGNVRHPFLHQFKQCALSDMSVNYTGENVYATYNDGTPIAIIMNLTFKELYPIYNSDYDNVDLAYQVDKEIGGVGY